MEDNKEVVTDQEWSQASAELLGRLVRFLLPFMVELDAHIDKRL